MRHGIDLKTHSQCQMLGADAPTGQRPDLFHFIIRYLPGARAGEPPSAASGGAYRDRTDDPLLAKQVLSQLS